MTLKYKSVKLKNPAKPTEPAKYYARESESGRIDLPELADNIARHSTTVSKTDIQAVLTILGEELASLLAKGHSVHLGELGYFHVTLKSNTMLKAELVLYASAKCFNEYDKAVIVSGDGDFGCLVEYLQQNDKLLALVCPNKRYSSLLRKYRGYINIIGNTRNKLEYKKARNSVRSKP